MGVQSKIQNERALVGKMWDSTKISFALVRNEVLGQKKNMRTAALLGSTVCCTHREKRAYIQKHISVNLFKML